MKTNTKFSRLLCLLLTLVMLLRLFPIATVLAADEESHPTKVGYLSEKYEACYIAEGGFIFAEKNGGSSSEGKWNEYKTRLGTKITESAGDISGKNIEGVAYYDSASGVLYVTGNVYTIVSAVVVSTARDDVLKVVVDGNTNNDGGWCVTEINHCLDKLNIEFRNNGTLTLRKRSGNSVVLGVIGYNGQPGTVNWSTDPFWFGDLELSGTGKLKINVSDDEQKLLCGIRAKDISIKDNVSLDIKMGKSNASVMYRGNAAMICKSLTIDTTGTVQIDTALEGSFNRFSVFAPIAGYYVYSDPKESFNLVNAQSVTLKAKVKNELFDTRFGFGGSQNDLGDRICEDHRTKNWMVTESADDSSPYTVTMTRAAMPAAELTVGDNAPVQSNVTIPNVTVTGGETVAVKASVTLPTWLSNMYTDGRVKLGDSRTMNIYKGNSLSSADLVTGSNMTGYAVITNATALPAISFETSNFKPVSGQTYTVYASFPVVTTNGGKQLGSAGVIATIKAAEKPISQVLSGSILYTSGVRYGADVTTARTGAVNDIDSNKLHYQWQAKSGDAWEDISGATAGKLDADKVNTVVGKEIRLKITADGYEGVLYSPVKTVAKAAQTNIPVAPVLTCLVSTEPDGGAMVKLTNKQDGQEYLLSSSAMTDTELATASSDKWSDDGRNYVRKGFTFYIYTRMKETDTHAAGTIYRYSTIYTGNVVDLKNLALAGYTNKIYVKKGEPLTIDVVGTPANANKWNAVHFIEQDNTANNFTVKVDDSSTNYISAGTGTEVFGNHKITITSDTVGSHTLVASPSDEYNPYATSFGSWTVVVYEPGNITNFDIIDPPTYADVTLAVGESYAPELTNPTLTTKPAEAMTDHTLKWFVRTPATSTGVPTFSDNNGYISVDENGKVTALAANGTVNDDYKVVALHVVDRDGNFIKSVASYKVTVNPVTAPALESISVHPGALTLKNGDSADLTAIKNPVNAEGIVTWSSSNISVATVDSAGKVTAVGVGTATITVTCGTKTATCTVNVTCTTHTYGETWTKTDDTNHYRVCTTCGEGMEIAEHSYGEHYTNDVDAGQHYRECRCGYKHYEDHTPNIPVATATEDVICSKCNTKLANRLGNSTAKIVFTVTVKQSGNVAPGKQEFELEIFDYNGEPYNGLTVTAKLKTNGKGDYDGELLIYGAADQVSALIGGGFFVREKDTKAANWTYSNAVWYVDMSGESAAFCPAELQITDNGNYYVYDEADPAEKLIFVNTYTENKTVNPESPKDAINLEDSKNPTKFEELKSPQTGDNSMIGMWITLLFVSGSVLTGTTLYSRKKRAKNRRKIS